MGLTDMTRQDKKQRIVLNLPNQLLEQNTGIPLPRLPRMKQTKPSIAADESRPTIPAVSPMAGISSITH